MIAWPGPVADLEEPLARRAAAAGEPVAAVLAGEHAAELLEPVRSREGASDVSTSTSAGSAVSCEERITSSACSSGESSAPSAAWIPPCAFEELFACSVVLVATATRAPARSAETAAAKPGGAAADHEHVDGGARRHAGGMLPESR